MVASDALRPMASRTQGRPVRALLLDGTIVWVRGLQEAAAPLVAGFRGTPAPTTDPALRVLGC